MKPFSLPVRSNQHCQFIDITADINQLVAASGVEEGICFVFIPHTTAALTINEGADRTVAEDIIRRLQSIIPWENGYRHREGNSAAHIKASVLGTSHNVIISENRLLLGTWQSIFFCEFDGPRDRKVKVKIIPD